LAVLAARVGESYSLLLPFLTDDRDARRRYDAALGQSTRRVEEVLGFVPPILNRCPLLMVSGRWDEAETLWAERRMALVNSGDVAGNLSYIGAIARAQGARARAWACVREGLPDGPLTEPGGAYFDATVRLQCLAARLALEDEDLETARQWLEAHDRWLTWAGPEVRWGRSDGRLAWAEYERARGEAGSALRHAECALAAAGEPRQPLALLTAHRLLGELHIETGRFAEAQQHLDQALVLADACAAPYERALTLLPQARLDAATSKLEEAWQRLDAVRAVCAPLGAAVALARADALAERFNAPPAAPAYPAGLSAREAEVLRLVAQGLTNSQVAERLYLSPRTVENHLRSIYGKLGVPTRAAAAHFAVSHGLA
jgi:DNA-binding CsgD family transcriptional regulator/tetratricopeptide (TPR) repeat protein